MHPVTAAYLAAMVDGEGVVTIGRLRSRGRRRQFKYYARVLVTNSHEGLVRFMYEATGLGLVYRYSHAAKEGWSVMLRWQVSHRQAVLLLRDLRPFLVIKARQADLVLAMPMQTEDGRLPADDDAYAAQQAAHAAVKRSTYAGPSKTLCSRSFRATTQPSPVSTGWFGVTRGTPAAVWTQTTSRCRCAAGSGAAPPAADRASRFGSQDGCLRVDQAAMDRLLDWPADHATSSDWQTLHAVEGRTPLDVLLVTPGGQLKPAARAGQGKAGPVQAGLTGIGVGTGTRRSLLARPGATGLPAWRTYSGSPSWSYPLRHLVGDQAPPRRPEYVSLCLIKRVSAVEIIATGSVSTAYAKRPR